MNKKIYSYKLKYFILVLIFLVSCQSEPSKNVEQKSVPVTNMDHEKTLVVPWVVQMNDSTHAMEIKKDPAADMAHLGPKDLVDALNLKYPQIRLEWIKLEGNKAFVKINDSSYLTQQAGSEGAEAYLAEVTYSLTELKEIAAVDFSFKEGDHAVAGVYTRDSFKDL